LFEEDSLFKGEVVFSTFTHVPLTHAPFSGTDEELPVTASLVQFPPNKASLEEAFRGRLSAFGRDFHDI
jgi:hypothetical protein